jgi:hypothetical protein
MHGVPPLHFGSRLRTGHEKEFVFAGMPGWLNRAGGGWRAAGGTANTAGHPSRFAAGGHCAWPWDARHGQR